MASLSLKKKKNTAAFMSSLRQIRCCMRIKVSIKGAKGPEVTAPPRDRSGDYLGEPFVL